VFEELDDKEMEGFGSHVFQGKVYYLYPIALVQTERDKQSQLICAKQ